MSARPKTGKARVRVGGGPSRVQLRTLFALKRVCVSGLSVPHVQQHTQLSGRKTELVTDTLLHIQLLERRAQGVERLARRDEACGRHLLVHLDNGVPRDL